MYELMRCDVCKGRKRVLGMGGMENKCQSCKGVGWIEAENNRPVSIENLKTPSGAPVAARRKPGPKPKMKEEEVNNA